jgi:hypothetical protein
VSVNRALSDVLEQGGLPRACLAAQHDGGASAVHHIREVSFEDAAFV